MIVSVNWLKKFTSIDMPAQELATLIGARLVEIEEVVDLGSKYKGVVVAEVVECAPLEGSDHLNVTKINDGGVAEGVERDENGLVQVVCGAPNVRAGLKVAWLPPNSTVPETYNDAEPFVLGARKLRGVMSNGMLASAKELDLFEDHDGILEIDADVAAGTKFAEAYELDDYLLDIENKSLTHRPDAFGLIGFAREVAAISGQAFKTPAELDIEAGLKWLDKTGDIETPSVTIEDPELSARYQAVVLGDVDATKQSPLLIQTYLARVGVRPINAIVDATNYIMMLTGQPLHAFDYDKLLAVADGKADMRVRSGRVGEKLALLDGREIELSEGDIVIANGDVAVALAGAMGGADTEVDDNTKRVLLESATFNLYNLRNTQMRHGIFSEAITRFTKGQPAELTAPALAWAVTVLSENAGVVRLSEVADAYPNSTDTEEIELSAERANNLLGTDYDAEFMATTLANVGCKVSVNGTTLAVTVPYWRADMHIAEDVVEEIGRLNGFDNIAPTLPLRDFTAVSPDAFDKLRAKLRKSLVRAGANEVLTYSFVHGDVLRKAGLDESKSYRITNSLSPDLQYYRQSLTPSLLGLVHGNIKAGFDEFALFEMNKVHSKTSALVDDDVPAEMHRLALVVARKKSTAGAPYYQAKALLEYLGQSLGLKLVYRSLPTDSKLAVAQPFEPRRSARVIDELSGQSLGIVGEYKKSVSRNFKLPEYAAGFELLTEGIALALANQKPQYSPLSRYPSSERDICFQVGREVNYDQIVESAELALRDVELDHLVAPIDIYSAENSDTKNITVRLKLTSHGRTLTGDDVTKVVERVIQEVVDATSAVVI